jgi:hypothetical protein
MPRIDREREFDTAAPIPALGVSPGMICASAVHAASAATPAAIRTQRKLPDKRCMSSPAEVDIDQSQPAILGDFRSAHPHRKKPIKLRINAAGQFLAPRDPPGLLDLRMSGQPRPCRLGVSGIAEPLYVGA